MIDMAMECQEVVSQVPAVERAISILHADSECFEVRALKVPGYRGSTFTSAGYFNDREKAAHGACVVSDRGAGGLYFTLNPVNEALLARANNRMKDRLNQTTTDAEIVRRNWVIIDIDPARPAGISATDVERRAACDVAHECEAHLTSQGWPLPVIGSSGNGYALFYRVDLPNDAESRNLVAGVLKALDATMREKCGDAAHVDTSTFNAARIVRAFGTVNRKGDSTPDRPHRLTELYDPPERLDVVSAELLRKVADQSPSRQQASTSETPRPYTQNGHSNSSPIERARRYIAKMPPAISGSGGHNQTYAVARTLYNDFALERSDAWTLLSDYNLRCEPPWDEKDLAHKLDSAIKAGGERGRLAKARTARRVATQTLEAGTKVRAADRNNFGEVTQDHGATATVRFVSPEGNTADVELPKSGLRLADWSPASPDRLYQPAWITSAEFESGSYDQRYLVNRVLVAGQHGIIGERYKTLKTSVGMDLAISLGSGTHFLGEFKAERARTVFLSGESGEFTLRETARRVAAAKGIQLPAVDVQFGFEVPQIARAGDLDAMAEAIDEGDIEVLLLDPVYLSLMAGDTAGKQASNLFDMGPILLGLSDVAKSTGCTLILLHHCRKNTAEPHSPPELDELSMAGFAEWARQWLLLGRREAYEADSGLHRLWLNIGGSAGHSGCYAVDINEGRLGDDFTGRKWEVDVKRSGDARKEAAAAKEQQRAEQQERRDEDSRRRLLDALGRFRDGETATGLREVSGLNSPNFGTAMRSLMKEGRAEKCVVTKGNGREYSGYRPTGK